METKPLLYGLIGFFIGGLLVSVAATTFEKPSLQSKTTNSSQMTMGEMVTSLQDKKGDDFDKAFIDEMIAHHQGAVDMARLSANNAKHDELKIMSKEIVKAQEKEIEQMKHWRADWGYSQEPTHDTGH